jgi:hypothetical protein
MENFILEHLHVPIDSILHSEVWLNSPYRYIRSGDDRFRSVADVISSRISRYNIIELATLWQNSEYKFWEHKQNIDYDIYLPLSESIDVTIKFLLYQLGFEECIKDFLNNLLNIFDRKVPKKNAFEVIGPPTSGKNWFFDSIITFAIASGQIMNANKSTNFPFDHCFNKRILFINGPNFEYGFEDKLLMLFAGDPFHDQAKYKNVAFIKRTPVIITGNVSRFKNEAKWNDRMYRYTWNRATMLKDVKKKCHPFTFYQLCIKYNLY